MSENLRMTVPGNPDYIKVVKITVGSVAAANGFDIDSIEDIKMAVAEACKIVTCHSSDKWSSSYEVNFDMGEKTIAIEVKADCSSHCVEKGKMPCEDCPNEGDIGIQMIKTLMDEVDIEKEENAFLNIKMVKKLC